MRKRVSLVLIIAFVVAIFGGCGATGASGSASPAATVQAGTNTSAAASEKPATPKAFTLGSTFDPGTSSFGLALKLNMETVVGACGGTVVYQSSDFSPDGTIQAVEKLITSGVSGLFIVPPADSVLPKIMQMCEEAGVYWGISFRVIQDEAIREMVEASKYYVGNCFEDEEAAGYNVGAILGDLGFKKIAIVSTVKGDTTGDLREAGLARACEKYGMEIVAEARGLSQASDMTKAVESFISSYPDLDCVFQVGSTATGAFPAMTKAVTDAGKADQIKVACIDFQEGLVEALQSGLCVAACGGHLVADPTLVTAMLCNSIIGSPLSEDEKLSVTVSFMYLKDGADADNYFTLVEGTSPIYTETEAKDLLIKYFNPEVTASTFKDVAKRYSIQDLVARRQQE